MSASAFVKGLGAGLIVGSVVFLCCGKKSCKKKKGIMRAVRNIGGVVEDVTDLLGL